MKNIFLDKKILFLVFLIAFTTLTLTLTLASQNNSLKPVYAQDTCCDYTGCVRDSCYENNECTPKSGDYKDKKDFYGCCSGVSSKDASGQEICRSAGGDGGGTCYGTIYDYKQNYTTCTDVLASYCKWTDNKCSCTPATASCSLADNNQTSCTQLAGCSWDTPVAPASGNSPIGSLDRADCNQFAGWAGDKDQPRQAINVKLYSDQVNEDHLLGTATANLAREAVVCQSLGTDQSPCNHGFSFTTPNSLKDGVAHQIFAVGVNIAGTGGENARLSGVPKSINCTLGTTPALTPTTPTGGPACAKKSEGDANCNGNVDGIDYSIWLNNQCHPEAGQTCADSRADFNSDGNVDDTDYNIWLSGSS